MHKHITHEISFNIQSIILTPSYRSCTDRIERDLLEKHIQDLWYDISNKLGWQFNA